MNRSPLIAYAGGTIVIAVMVLAAFANMAAAGTTCPRSQQQVTTEQVEPAPRDTTSTDA